MASLQQLLMSDTELSSLSLSPPFFPAPTPPLSLSHSRYLYITTAASKITPSSHCDRTNFPFSLSFFLFLSLSLFLFRSLSLSLSLARAFSLFLSLPLSFPLSLSLLSHTLRPLATPLLPHLPHSLSFPPLCNLSLSITGMASLTRLRMNDTELSRREATCAMANALP